MSDERRILVVTEARSDADMIGKLLGAEFDHVQVSTVPGHFVSDFEHHRPHVLVLAFKSLQESERYYLGLYRRSQVIHTLAHRTVLLCAKEEVRKAYEQCRKGSFDDYVQFWPLAHDASRLPMSVHLALDMLALSQATAPLAKLAAQARRISELEARLEGQIAQGSARAESASQSLEQARVQVGAALDRFTRKIIGGELSDALLVKDAEEVQREFGRLNSEEVQAPFDRALKAAEPIREWMGTLKAELSPQLEAARVMAGVAETVRPLVLVVEDDDYASGLLARIMDAERYEVTIATNGTAALAGLRNRRPDIVLMDFQLPDIDGVEVTRRLKAVPEYENIPVVMITGKSEKNVIVESLAAGAADFVVKPFEREILLKKVAKLLAG